MVLDIVGGMVVVLEEVEDVDMDMGVEVEVEVEVEVGVELVVAATAQELYKQFEAEWCFARLKQNMEHSAQ